MMKKSFFILTLVLIFSNQSFAKDNRWDEFFKDSGFPKKVVDDGSVVKGKILDTIVTYQIKNNDGIKGNFENSDSALVTLTNKIGGTISTEKFLNVKELRAWGKTNFIELFSFLTKEQKLDQKTLTELTNLAFLALSNKNLD